MDLAVITAKQVTELLLMILAGAVCCKAGVFKENDKSVLSNLLIYLVVPCMVLNSYLVDFDPSTFQNLMLSFALSTLVLVLGLVVAFVVSRRVHKDVRSICWFACGFSNAGYMGLPLIRALFGQEGLLYASGFLTVFNILIWAVGYTVLAGKADVKSIARTIVTCPCLIAIAAGLVIYLARIPLPSLLTEAIGVVGDMNTPMSMIITGITIAASDLGRLIRNKNLFFVLGVRMLLIPAVNLAVFALLGLHGMVPTIVLLLEACPCAAITTMFAIQCHHDEELAAGSVVFTTLSSILMLPLYALAVTLVL